MQISMLSDTATAIHQDVIAKYGSLINNNAAISGYVTTQIDQWKARTGKTLEDQYPFRTHEEAFFSYKNNMVGNTLANNDFEKAIDHFSQFCKAAKLYANESFWRNELVQNETDVPSQKDLMVSHRLFISEWQKKIDQANSEWHLHRLQQLRQEVLNNIETFLQLMLTLQQQLSALGLEPGILLDLSRGNLSAHDIEDFKRWSQYLSEDKGVRDLCDLLGKINQIALSEKIERATLPYTSKLLVPDINSKEEIVGLRLGRDLEHALPSELALLADPDTAILFDLKFVESRLMCFDLQGTQTINQNDHIEADVHAKEEDQKGPLILCVDTSGSMSGMPETIAKAVTLYMSLKAKEQKRACYLINFSTTISTLDFSGDMTMSSLLDFLKMSFHGGTDASPALDHALDMLQQETYKKADVLMLSDFVMSTLPEGMHQKIEKQSCENNKFYSLVIGSCFMEHRLKSIFDQEWIYNPNTSSIHELIRFQQSIPLSGQTV